MIQEIIDESHTQPNNQHIENSNDEMDDLEDNDEDDDGPQSLYRKYEKVELVNSKTINDILKYGAGHLSVDSNPGETQSEWSDEDDKDDEEVKGGQSYLCIVFSIHFGFY